MDKPELTPEQVRAALRLMTEPRCYYATPRTRTEATEGVAFTRYEVLARAADLIDAAYCNS